MAGPSNQCCELTGEDVSSKTLQKQVQPSQRPVRRDDRPMSTQPRLKGPAAWADPDTTSLGGGKGEARDVT